VYVVLVATIKMTFFFNDLEKVGSTLCSSPHQT
jgi:hypothetical protein